MTQSRAYLFLWALGLYLFGMQASANADCWQELALQNPRAVAVGETIYLPQRHPNAEEACPLQGDWSLIAQPKASQNQIFDKDKSEPRFSPDQAGRYQFEERNTGYRWTMQAELRGTKERFRNHYLTPLYGATRVGAELWVANGAAYSVSKVTRGSDGRYVTQGEYPTGAWPAAVVGDERLPYVLIAQRGADSIAYVERASGRLLDAVWVGDEPTGLALSPDAKTLYISLATQRKIAVLDVAAHQKLASIPVGFDPRALALSADGKTLFAASYRSANLSYGPGGARPQETDLDVFVIDTASRRWIKSYASLAADLRAMVWDESEQALYIAATDGDTLVAQNAPEAKSFVHQLLRLKLANSGRTLRKGRLESVDLSRQPSAQGPFVNPSGVLVQGDQVWVAAESSHEVLILDRKTLAEKRRIKVGQGPRQLVLLEDGVAVHGFQSFTLDILSFAGDHRQTLSLAEDPRPPAVALGEHVFTRPGLSFGANHSCSSCHIETQNDGMIWNFGPQVWHNVRPIQLAAATTPLSWSSYAANAKSFGYMGPLSIMNRPPNNEEALGLGAFMDSLLGAPRATEDTQKDGSYSSEALSGKALFEGKAKCASCHTAPLYTNRRLLAVGKSGKEADVPTLLGAYRHGIYMIKGQARDLASAVDIALDFVKVSLDPSETKALIRFLKELTPKGAYPLAIWPDIDTATLVPLDARPRVAFSEAVDDTREQPSQAELLRSYIQLLDKAGQIVKVSYEVKGGEVTLLPEAKLRPGESYQLIVKAGLPFRDGSVQEADRSSRFITSKAPTRELPRKLRLFVNLPRSGSGTVFLQKDEGLPLEFIRTTSEGQELSLDLGGGRKQTLLLLQDGETLHLQSFALPVPSGDDSALADASAVIGRFEELGPVLAKGTLDVGAPGLKIPQVPWRLEVEAQP